MFSHGEGLSTGLKSGIWMFSLLNDEFVRSTSSVEFHAHVRKCGKWFKIQRQNSAIRIGGFIDEMVILGLSRLEQACVNLYFLDSKKNSKSKNFFAPYNVK